MPKQAAKTVFVLERINWRRHEAGLARLAGAVRLASFDDRDQAEAALREKEREVRASVNPFTCGGSALHHQTSLDEGRLHDWALDLGLTPPKGAKTGPPNWADWWKMNHKRMSEYQREKMWEALDRLRFYQVVEREARPLVYLVVHVNWRYNDQWFVAEAEGGSVVGAYRDRRTAEDEADDYNDLGRDAWEESFEPGDDMRAFDARQRDQARDLMPVRGKKHDLIPLKDAVLYEVIEVELEE